MAEHGIDLSKAAGVQAGGPDAKEKLGTWLEELVRLRLAGAHLADGSDPDEHVPELREGWD